MGLRNSFNRVLHPILFRSLHWLKNRGRARGTISEICQMWYDLPVDPVHFYSPLPDVPKVRKNITRWRQPSQLPAINMDLDKQRSFLEGLRPFAPECNQLPSFSRITELGFGLGYGEIEAHFLHCMIRHFKPQCLLEVGSGVSTYFSLNAFEMNAKERGTANGQIHCIEPYPAEKLITLVKEKRLTLDVKEVQDVPVSAFESLNKNDILFIDSSHAGKVDSDVYYLYLEILPRLKTGVIVHIHDICFPFLTCPPEHPVFPLSMLWNEGALCQAFLAFNDAFEILMCQSYLHYKESATLKNLLSISMIRPGISRRRCG